MTINVAIATYDSIILGCDSLSSVVRRVIQPFDSATFATDAAGNFLKDANGNYLIALTPENITPIPTHVFGGVNKMFCVYQDEDTSVSAITAGLATLNAVTISGVSKSYKRRCRDNKMQFSTTEAVAVDFLSFVRSEWEREVAYDSVQPDRRHLLSNLYFLIAGFAKDDAYGKVFRLDVAANTCAEEFSDRPHTGICWAGQADVVERLVRGFDSHARWEIYRGVVAAMESQRLSLLRELEAQVSKARIQIPEGFEFSFTDQGEPTLPWDHAQLDIDWGNLPVQYAVELASLLVNTQSGSQRFARGIATVGGRTHIGVLRPGEPFRMLNEPEITHTHVGYADDA